MPESDEIKKDAEKIEIPKDKKGLSSKIIILGVTGYLLVLVLMIAGMVFFLKPDVTPVVSVRPVVNATQVPDKKPIKEIKDPDIDKIVENFVDEPENVDISDLVHELKEIEYRSNLRNKMEQDSVARLQAERQTKIAQAKLEALKIQTAKLISARPKPTEVTNENVKDDSEKNKLAQAKAENTAASKKGFKQLAKIYSSMKPKDAAKILDKMETKLVVNLLASMKDRSAAKILSSFKPEKAARISKRMNIKFAQI